MTPIIRGDNIAEDFLKRRDSKLTANNNKEDIHDKIHEAVKSKNYHTAHTLIESHLNEELKNQDNYPDNSK